MQSRLQLSVRAVYQLFARAACAGAVLCMGYSSRAQNLFASDGSANIFEYTQGGAQGTFASGMNGPAFMAFNSAGDLFVTEYVGYDSGAIIEITPSGVQSTFASGLPGPAGIAFNSAGDLFVGTTTGDDGGGVIEISPSGKQSTFISSYNSLLESPNALAFNSAGDLFVANGGLGQVVEYTPKGVASFFASQLGPAGPASLAFNSAGDLFVTDNLVNNADSEGDIYEYTPSGKQSIFATGLYNPTALAVNSAGDVFVIAEANKSDAGGNDTIYEFTPGGTKSTFATSDVPLSGLAFQPLPEPSTLGMLIVGLTTLFFRRLKLSA